MSFGPRRWWLVSALVLLPYWPGGDTEPVYPDRVAVVNTVGYLPKLREAIGDWNACGARIHLYRSDGAPKLPGTITIVDEAWDGVAQPWGGWMGEFGLVSLGTVAWHRTLHVIAHEVGHALGFGHTQRDSVEGDARTVTPLDCKGLRAYYGT